MNFKHISIFLLLFFIHSLQLFPFPGEFHKTCLSLQFITDEEHVSHCAVTMLMRKLWRDSFFPHHSLTSPQKAKKHTR